MVPSKMPARRPSTVVVVFALVTSGMTASTFCSDAAASLGCVSPSPGTDRSRTPTTFDGSALGLRATDQSPPANSSFTGWAPMTTRIELCGEIVQPDGYLSATGALFAGWGVNLLSLDPPETVRATITAAATMTATSA